MFPCVGAGALPTLRREVADGGAIITQLALLGSGVAGQYRSLSKKLTNWGPWKIDHVTGRCLELGCVSLLQIELHSLEINCAYFRNNAKQ